MFEFPNLNVFVVLMAIVNCEYASNVIDVDDILAEDYMPGTLLVLENPTSGINHFNGSLKKIETMKKIPDGSFGNAMGTMNFHRYMMNQYLCRNFVAEQIIKDMTTSRVNRRMGHITPGSESSKFKSAPESNLLNDEGSSNYKNWLAKSATLEDIYRHYDQPQNRIDAEIIEDEDKEGEDFDEEYNGHVTGYVYPQPHEGQSPVKHRGHTGLGMYYAGGGGSYPNAVYHNHGGGSDYHHGGGSGYHGGSTSGYHYNGVSGSHGGDSGYHHSAGGGGGYSHDGGYGDGDYSHHDSSVGGHSGYSGGHAVIETIYHSNPPKYHGQQEASYGGKDHDLSDLFDIALTALAFLSFGLFIVHVIMCISAATHSTTTTAASMIMPMSMSPTATATGTGNGGGGGGGGGGSMTSTGDGGTGGGATSTGMGGGDTGTEGEMTATGGGSTSMGGGDTGTDGGNADSTGGENTGTAGTGTGGGDIDGGGGGTGGGNTSAGGGDADTGGSLNVDTGDGDAGMGGGGGTGSGNTGSGDTNTGDGTGDNTGSASPGTGTGTGDGTTGDGSTGTGGGGTGTGNGGYAGTGTGSGRDTFKFRLRRDIPTITNPNNQALNELARRILTSIEAALVANNDKGVCLRRSLCENNRYSRNLEGKDKIIIPMWSLGMSWLAGRLVKNVTPATSMLDTLKASILGLGRANCEIIYQDCDLKKQRRRRRKR